MYMTRGGKPLCKNFVVSFSVYSTLKLYYFKTVEDRTLKLATKMLTRNSSVDEIGERHVIVVKLYHSYIFS